MDELFALALDVQTRGGAEGIKTLRDIENAGKGVASRFSALLKPVGLFKATLATIGIGFTVDKVASFFGAAIHEATDAQAALERYKQALENNGEAYDDFSERQEKATRSLQKMTRFSDDEGTAALAEMTTISKDAAGSIENLGLVADIAAAKQISLESSATLVGRVMAGNTSMLARYGIVVKDETKAMDELRKTFSGFAERDGATFQGRLERVRNAALDVLEALGNVVIGGDELSGTADDLVGQLEKLSNYIDDNAEDWRRWAKMMLDDTGGPLAGLNKFVDRITVLALRLNGIKEGLKGNGWDFTALEEYERRMGRVAQNARGGGGGGGRDTPTGPITLAPAVVMATPPKRTTKPPPSTSKGKTTKAAPFDPFNAQIVTQPINDIIGRIDATPIRPSGINFDQVEVPGVGMSADQLDDVFKNYHESIEENAKKTRQLTEEEAQKSADAMRSVSETITGGMAQTLGNSITSAFEAAFDGEGIGGAIKAFAKTVLAGVGSIFTNLGMIYLEYGGIMQALSALLPNPFTAGPAGLAIGAALIAMGAALGAVGRNKSPSASGRSSSLSGYGGGTEALTRLKFVDRPDASTKGLRRESTTVINLIGENDPRAQRALIRMVDKGRRRAA